MNYCGPNHDTVNSLADLYISLPTSTTPLQSSTASPTTTAVSNGREPCDDLPHANSPLPPPPSASFCQEPSHIRHNSICDSDTLLTCSDCREFTSCIRCLTVSSHALRSAQKEVLKYPAKTLAPLCDSCAIPVVADLRLDTNNNCTCPTRLRVSDFEPKESEKFWLQGPVLCVRCKSRYLQRLVHTIRMYEWLCEEAGGRRICARCRKVPPSERYLALMCLGCKEGAMFNVHTGIAEVESWEMPPGRQTWESATAHIIGGMSCLEKTVNKT